MEYTKIGNELILFHNAIKDPQKYHQIIMDDQNCHTLARKNTPIEFVALDRNTKLNCPMNFILEDFEKVMSQCMAIYCDENNIKSYNFGKKTVAYRLPNGSSLEKHNDQIDGQGKTANILGYLNNDYDGGEILIDDYGFDYKPIPGELIIFNPVIFHSVNTVLNGTRYNVANSVLDLLT